MKDKNKRYWHKLLWNEIEDEEFQFWVNQAVRHPDKFPALGFLKRRFIYFVVIVVVAIVRPWFVNLLATNEDDKFAYSFYIFLSLIFTIAAIETFIYSKRYIVWLNQLPITERTQYWSIQKRKIGRALQLLMYCLVGTALICAPIYFYTMR